MWKGTSRVLKSCGCGGYLHTNTSLLGKSHGSVFRAFSVSAPDLAGTTVRLAPKGNGVYVQDKRLSEEKFLHALWLRERTQNEDVIFVGSGQRKFTVSTMVNTDDAVLTDADISGERLRIQYQGGFRDELDMNAIISEIVDPYCLPTNFEGQTNVPTSQRLLPRKLWRDQDGTKRFDINNVKHDYQAMQTDKQKLYDFLCDLHVWGTALVENTPYDQKDYESFINTFGLIRPTNWGNWFEVFSKKEEKTESDSSTQDAAYTSDELPLHTDGPYNQNPLHFQLLQCLKQSPIGGESQLSDGYTAALMLDDDAREMLENTEVRFRYHDEKHELLTNRPILSRVRSEGEDYYEIFLSERLDLSPLMDPEHMDELFVAKGKYRSELYHPSNLAEFKLKEGDMLIFDNRRVLHGRAYFDEKAATKQATPDSDKAETMMTVGNVDLSKVNRYLRGCYLEGMETRLRALGRTAKPYGRQMSTLARRPTEKLNFPKPAYLSTERTVESLAGFQLKDCTAEDMALVSDLYKKESTGVKLGDRALHMLKLLTLPGPAPMSSDTHLGLPVDLYEHSLQTATRCLQAGCSDDVVVAGLLHDVGELLSPSNHGEFPAALLRPFVEPKVSWMLHHHEVFQMYYYNEKMTPPQDKNVRNHYKGAEAYDFTVEFCEKYDQMSFDPTFSSLEVKDFTPIVHRVFSRDPYWHTPNHPKRGAVTGA